LISIFPIYYIVVTSFKDKKEYLVNKLGIPTNFTLINFKTILSTEDFVRWFSNSIIVTAAAVIVGTLICCLAAYGFSRFEYRIKPMLLRTIISLMLIPPIVVFFPLFEFFVRVKLLSTLQGVIIIYMGFIIPFTIFLIYHFFITIPSDIVDAAIIDGCKDIRILFKIYIPLSMPAIITAVVVNAFWVWNELLIALIFLQNTKVKTLMAGLMQFKSRSTLNLPLAVSGLFMATIPIVLLFLGSQKFFTKGLLSGMGK
jgi:ABC-type glycerol-3-phosphate transport system permease component